MELLKFYAEWCSPCDMQSEILEDFDKIPVQDIDIEEEMELANEYAVRSVPTMILQDDEQVYERFTGITEVSELEEAVEKHS